MEEMLELRADEYRQIGKLFSMEKVQQHFSWHKFLITFFSDAFAFVSSYPLCKAESTSSASFSLLAKMILLAWRDGRTGGLEPPASKFTLPQQVLERWATQIRPLVPRWLQAGRAPRTRAPLCPLAQGMTALLTRPSAYWVTG